MLYFPALSFQTRDPGGNPGDGVGGGKAAFAGGASVVAVGVAGPNPVSLACSPREPSISLAASLPKVEAPEPPDACSRDVSEAADGAAVFGSLLDL
jgi:hypothetical protein